MSHKLHQLYFPLTVPHPERVRQWQLEQGYREVMCQPDDGFCVVRYLLKAPKPAAIGRRVAFLSDFHYRGTPKEQARLRALRQRLRQLRVDYLCLGGDLIADGIDLKWLPDLLGCFADAAPAVVMIPGNWEQGKIWLPPGYWQRQCEPFSIDFLNNRTFRDETFAIHGCEDYTNGTPRLPEHFDAERTNLLLIHRPDALIALDSGNALHALPLALCGHTHGGQIRLPGIGPLYASSRYGCKLAYGLFRKLDGNTRMIVSSGIGELSFPLRFRCRRELVLVEFTE